MLSNLRYSLFVLGAMKLQDVVQNAVLQVCDELVHSPHKLVPVQSEKWKNSASRKECEISE